MEHTGKVADLGLSLAIVVECTSVIRRVRADDLDQALARSPGGIKVVRGLAQP